MQAGKLRHRITIQQLIDGQDEIGQPAQTWSDVATVWADIRHKSGSEAIKADQVTSTVQASIRIRYRTGINAGMRAVHGATVYDIKSVLPDERSREHVDLVCEAANG
jgi:SPP1 family predicted phage head-tail adaptor